MQIVEDKALLFRTRDPSKYSIIPKHKVFSNPQGGFDVAVYWGLDEARVLKNLGVKDAVPNHTALRMARTLQTDEAPDRHRIVSYASSQSFLF